MKNKILILSVVAVVLITACNAQGAPSTLALTALNPSLPTQAETGIPTGKPAALGDVKVYRDQNAGLALDYPAAWQLEDNSLKGAADSAVYTSSLFSWDRAAHTPAPKDLNTPSEGAAQVDVTVFNQGPGTLAEAVNQFKNQDSGSTVSFLKEEDWTLNSGENAVYLESRGALGTIATMITRVNGKTVYVSGSGDLTLFKAIALTLRPD